MPFPAKSSKIGLKVGKWTAYNFYWSVSIRALLAVLRLSIENLTVTLALTVSVI